MSVLTGLISRFRTRRTQALTTIELSHSSVAELLFGQQHLGTQEFFRLRNGQAHTVPVPCFPHAEFLEGWLQKHQASDNPYLQYLEASWSYYFPGGGNTPAKRIARVERFANQFQRIAQQAELMPIQVCRRPDGRYVIVDGNHRAAIAYRLGRGLKAEVLPLAQRLSQITCIPDEFYGSKRLEKPYQSIFHGGQCLLEGRRTDVAARIRHISEADLRGKSVLDLGCNLGMSCYLAAERGAAMLVGVEGSPNIATAAVRLNSLLAAPCRFIQHDLNRELDCGKFDTVFCFSVINHVQNKDAIVRTLDKAIGKVLYFEGHAQTSLADYTYFLNKSRFSRIELLAHTSDGVHATSKTRPLWRCEI
jgi:hypothetical protein